jgi:hypothetical protein
MPVEGAWWTCWELFGGARPELLRLLRQARPKGVEPGLELVSFGPGGLWPHVIGFWPLPAGRLDRVLSAGDGDGSDETGFRWARSKLLRAVSGDFDADRTAYLIEYVRFADQAAVENLDGPDLVFVEAFAPSQVVLLWGADSHDECVARERAGWGSAHLHPEDRLAWWAVTAGGDDSGYLAAWFADPALETDR